MFPDISAWCLAWRWCNDGEGLTSGDQVFVHASDTQCLPAEAIAKIIDWHPDIVFIAGPPLYLQALRKEEGQRAIQNISLLARYVSHVIVDHHLIRSLQGLQLLDTLTTSTGGRVMSAAGFMRRPPIPLEACRKQLYERYPPEKRDWSSLLTEIAEKGLLSSNFWEYTGNQK